jgi:hypothetical protein
MVKGCRCKSKGVLECPVHAVIGPIEPFFAKMISRNPLPTGGKTYVDDKRIEAAAEERLP